jgi:hypothetical protein
MIRCAVCISVLCTVMDPACQSYRQPFTVNYSPQLIGSLLITTCAPGGTSFISLYSNSSILIQDRPATRAVLYQQGNTGYAIY